MYGWLKVSSIMTPKIFNNLCFGEHWPLLLRVWKLRLHKNWLPILAEREVPQHKNWWSGEIMMGMGLCLRPPPPPPRGGTHLSTGFGGGGGEVKTWPCLKPLGAQKIHPVTIDLTKTFIMHIPCCNIAHLGYSLSYCYFTVKKKKKKKTRNLLRPARTVALWCRDRGPVVNIVGWEATLW